MTWVLSKTKFNVCYTSSFDYVIWRSRKKSSQIFLCNQDQFLALQELVEKQISRHLTGRRYTIEFDDVIEIHLCTVGKLGQSTCMCSIHGRLLVKGTVPDRWRCMFYSRSFVRVFPAFTTCMCMRCMCCWLLNSHSMLLLSSDVPADAKYNCCICHLCWSTVISMRHNA